MIVSIEGHTPDVSSAAFVADNATVCGDVKVGEDSSIWFGAVLRAECEPLRIGDRTNVQDNVVVHIDSGFPVTIGSDVTVGHGAIVHGCTVEDGVLIGMGSTILDHAVIGEGAIVAAGSLVLSNTVIEPGSIWGGVPAKFIKKVDPEQAKELNQKIAHNYLMYSSWYKE